MATQGNDRLRLKEKKRKKNASLLPEARVHLARGPLPLDLALFAAADIAVSGARR